MFKKILIITLSMLFIMLPIIDTSALSPPPIRVVLDGERLIFDASPRNVDGRIMVPMRAIFESLGATVEWDNETRIITATKDDIVVTAAIGNPNMRVGDKWISMDITPMIINERTFVPIRFVSEAFGIDVMWSEVEQIVYINTNVSDVYEEENVSALSPRREHTIPHRGRLMVMYHANGGIGAPISNTVTINEDGSVRFIHSRSEPRKEGYTFLGWRLENDEHFPINAPGSIVWVLDLDPDRNETIIYFAQWEREIE